MFQQQEYFEGQEDTYSILNKDNLSAQRIMIYIQHCCFDDLKNDAQNNGLEIIPDFETPAYRIRTTSQSLDQNVTIFDIKQRINFLTIIFYQAKTYEEAKAKLNLLGIDQNDQKMLNHVGCRIKVTHNELINFEEFPDQYLETISEMFDQQSQLVVVLENCQELDREVLQKRVDEFMNTMTQTNDLQMNQDENDSQIFNANVLEFDIIGSTSLKEAYFFKKFRDENIQFEIIGSKIQFFFMGSRNEIQRLKQIVSYEFHNLVQVSKEISFEQNDIILNFLLDNQNIGFVENLIHHNLRDQLVALKIASVQRSIIRVVIKVEILYNKYSLIEIENILYKVSQVLNSLKSIEFDVGIDRFLEFYLIEDSQKFCEMYKVKLSKQNSKDFAIGKLEQIDELVMLQSQYKEKNRQSQLLKTRKSTTITIENRLIYITVKARATEHLLGLSEQCTLTFPQNSNLIIIQCYDLNILKESLAKIKEFSDQLTKSICRIELKNYDQKTLDYLKDQCQQKIRNLEENYICQISIAQKQNINLGREEIIISYNEKKLILKNGIQTQQECDLTVLQTNDFKCLTNQNVGQPQKMLIQKFGNDYANHCINNVSKQGINDISVYPNQPNQKNILNIVTPIYKFSNNFYIQKEIIERNIRKIFQVAKELNLKSISITIYGSGACSNAFKQVSETFIIDIIDRLFTNDNIIQSVYIFEQYEPRFYELKNIAQMIVYPQRKRQIRFQWYYEEQDYKKYEELINSQIDEDFEIYKADKTQNKFQIEFSYLQFQATHSINLINKTIIDLKTKGIQNLEVSQFKGRKIYKIGLYQLDDRLINYLNLQELENKLEFEVCLTQNFIVFKEYEYYQENIDGARMLVYNQPLRFEQPQWRNHALLELDFIWDEKNYIQESEVNLNSVGVQTFDLDIQQAVLNQLDLIINENIVIFMYQVPNLFDEEINNLRKIVMASAISIKNQIEGGQQVEIKVFKNDHQLLAQNLGIFNETIRAYPKSWALQRNIVEKILLDPMSQEYQDIVKHFRETDKGQIHQIKRIQNKILWENYSIETNKLIKYHERIGYNMNNLERQRYVWHGVRGQHPKIIYEGMKEGFNCAFSANGMWGPGIYFAQNSSYSRGYSYRLQQEEGPQHQGRSIMLYCLLTTGKVENRNSDGNIRQPSNGFDCVSGVTGGSQVFILYAMDIRRAYPAYEIIFS